METWQAYAIMALVGALIGFGVGAFLEAVDDWYDKLRWLTAVLGGFLGGPLGFLLFADPWKYVGLVIVAVIGGVVGWVTGPKKDRTKAARAEMEAYKEELRQKGYDV